MTRSEKALHAILQQNELFLIKTYLKLLPTF